MTWMPCVPKTYAVVIYNWKSTINESLIIEIGDMVQIVEEYSTNWCRGFNIRNRNVLGIFPRAYIVEKQCKVTDNDIVVPIEDDIVREIAQVVREWSVIWKKLYIENESYRFQAVSNVMPELIKCRHQLMTGTLTQDQIRDMKLKVITKIDWGNRKLGLDLVPRIGFKVVEPDSMSIVQLYNIYLASSDNLQDASAKGTLRLKKEPKPIFNHHLYFCMRDFGHHFGEDIKCYFMLFDGTKQSFVSERFLVRISKEGFSTSEKLHSNCTIFTDLGNANLKDLYLVTHLMRMGKIVYSDNTKKTEKSTIALSQMYKRPYAVSVSRVSEAIDSRHNEHDERPFSLKIFQCDERDFYQFHENLINNKTGKYNIVSGQSNFEIKISLKLFKGEMCDIVEENPLLFKNISITKKLGFPDIIMPGDVRNDLYVILDKGEFERGGRSSGKNIEVTVLVLDSERNILSDYIYESSASEGASEYNSVIFYHSNTPTWCEHIRLTIPIDKFPTAHVRLEYRHCSTKEKNDKKLFGFSFVRLMDPVGATIADGAHELYVYKCEDPLKLVTTNYLVQPCSSKDTDFDPNAVQGFSRGPKEVISIRTLLCSTKLTQNTDLLSFLRWKSQPDRIQESLTGILRLDCAELVKFLQDVLDALFALFSTDEGHSTIHSGLVFRVLVSIFNSLNQSKFQHFKSVLDAYIKGHFAAALVYKGLLLSIKYCAVCITTTDIQDPLQDLFRSLEYIFKLIIQSRYLFAQATGGNHEESFRNDLFTVFEVINEMLSRTAPNITQTQVIFLQSISPVFDHLLDILPPVEVTKLAINMIDSIPKDNLSNQMNQAKLNSIKHIVSGKLFTDNESRSLLLLTTCKHLVIHLGHRDDLKLCTEILTEIIGFLFQKLHSAVYDSNLDQNIDILCVNMMYPLVETVWYLIDRNTSTIISPLIACMIGLFQLLNQYHYEHLWIQLLKYKSSDSNFLKAFLDKCFDLFTDLIRQEVYPNDWLFIKMIINKMILVILNELKEPLVSRFLIEHFEKKLWNKYFNLAVRYLTQQTLQLEHFSNIKREKILEKYGDLRVPLGSQLLSLWSQLREKKTYFIPSMIGPFLEVTLIREPEIRKSTLLIFFDMMECEHKVKGNFKQVESELIDKLDVLVSENKGDDEYRQLFHTILLKKVQVEGPDWKENGVIFITSIARLLERLLDYRSVIHGEENRDKRMSCTVNLLNFYKNEFNRKEMYLRYIYKLYDMHLACENYTEAACTMKLYANQLSWTSISPVFDPNYPNFPELKVKEILYLQIIQNFDKGKCWEKGIPLCKELAEIYETKLFNYDALSNILRTQAQFYDNILTKLRPEPEYFRVGFYGQSYPLFVRNKQFIYRGLEYERIGNFTQRLQTEFPAAQILMKNTPPDESIINFEGQYIQISNVKPLPENNTVISTKGVPEKISRFYHYNDVKKFQSDRPVHKGVIDKENEFRTLWIERTLIMTDSHLPGILRWFEVVKKSTQELSPVQFACETVQNIEKELRQLIESYSHDPKQNLNPFTMRLQGVIDANVQGGISKYQKAFFSSEYMKENPDLCPFVYKLKISIFEVIQVVEKGLVLHEKLAPNDVQPLHQRLVERFTQLKYSLSALQKFKKQQCDIINTPLPPLPLEKKYSNFNNFEQCNDDEGIYTKLMENKQSYHNNDDVVNGCDTPPLQPPPIPQRDPRLLSQANNYNCCTCHKNDKVVSLRNSTDYSRNSCDNCEPNLPPKPISMSLLDIDNDCSDGSKAPPLPPRGITPDRKLSTPPNVPKRISKKLLNFDTTINDNVVVLRNIQNNNSISSNSDVNNSNDLRDSGFSTTSLTDDNDLIPPPIPPKGCFLHKVFPNTSSDLLSAINNNNDNRSLMDNNDNDNDKYSIPK